MSGSTEQILTLDQLPQFREADADGLIGLRGYMNYFQDAATRYMHNLHLGNDTLPEERGICWVYSKYKLHICRRTDFSGPFRLESWVENKKPTVRLYQDLMISRSGDVCAFGRLEECLLDIANQKLCRLSAIGWPEGLASTRELELEPFSRIGKPDLELLALAGTHQVRYTDLDKSGHMNNLRYVDMLLNAFDSNFWGKYEISDFEIHYLNQSYEGEKLQLRCRADDHTAEVWAIKADQTPACVGLFSFKNAE